MDQRRPASASPAAADSRGQLSEDAITALHDGPDATWTSRSEALVELADLAALPAMSIPGSVARERFAEQLRGVSVGIALCVGDLRSTLVKEACAVLETLADVLGARLVDALGDDVLPALLRRSAVRKSVIRLSAMDAACAMLRRGAAAVSARVATHFADTVLDAKNPAHVRASAAEYLGILLATAPVPTLDKMGPELDEAVLVGCTDAMDGVRALSRENLRCLQKVDPNRASRVLDKLPRKVRELLEKKPVALGPPVQPTPRPLVVAAPRQPRRSMAARRRESREPTARAAAASRPVPVTATSFARAAKLQPPLRAESPHSSDSRAAPPPLPPSAARSNKLERRVPRARSYSLMPARVSAIPTTAMPPPAPNRAAWTKPPPPSRKSTAFRPARRSMVPGAVPFVATRNFGANTVAGRVGRSPTGIPGSTSTESLANSPPAFSRDCKEIPLPSSATNSPMGVEQLSRSLSATTLSSSPSNDLDASVDPETVDGSEHTASPGDSVGGIRRVSVSSSSTRSSGRSSSKGSTMAQEGSCTSHSSSFASSEEKRGFTARGENSLTRSSSRCSVKEGSQASNMSQIDFEESISDLINKTVVPKALDDDLGLGLPLAGSKFSITDLLNNTEQEITIRQTSPQKARKGRISFLLGESVTPRPIALKQESKTVAETSAPQGTTETKSPALSNSPAVSNTALGHDAPRSEKSPSFSSTYSKSSSATSSMGSRTSRIAKPAPARASAIRSRKFTGGLPARASNPTLKRVSAPKLTRVAPPGTNKENAPALGAQVLYRKRSAPGHGGVRKFGRDLTAKPNSASNIAAAAPASKPKPEASGLAALAESVKVAGQSRGNGWQTRLAAAKAVMEACAELQKEALTARLAERVTETLAMYAHDVHLRVVTHALDGAFYLLLNAASSGPLFAALERRPALLRAVLARTADKREAARLAAERVMQSFAVQFCADQQTVLLVRSHERGSARLAPAANAVADVLRRARDAAPRGKTLDGLVDMVAEGAAHRLADVRKAAAELGAELKKAVEAEELGAACERRRVRLAIFS